MAITIEMAPEDQAAVEDEAFARGMDLPDLAKLCFLEAARQRYAPFREFGTPEEEAADEAEWTERFAASGDLLERMAAKADEELR